MRNPYPPSCVTLTSESIITHDHNPQLIKFKMSNRSAFVVNTLTIAEVTSLYEDELRKSTPMDAAGCHKDCRRTHRSLMAGAYARIQLSKNMVTEWDETHPALRGVDRSNWCHAKAKFEIMVHHLAYRYANDFQHIPPNTDVMHLCGRGKAAFKKDGSAGCIAATCMAVGSHQQNMDAQRCRGTLMCQFCNLVTNACTHTPRCKTGTLPISEGVASVTVTFKDGTTKVYNM